jgi:spermidine/putrescine transport system permease protein
VPLVLIFIRSLWIEENAQVVDFLSIDNYVYFLVRPVFLKVLAKSIGIGLLVTLVSFLLGYPMAYFMARKVPDRWQGLALTVLMFPFLASHVVRIYGWVTILGREGLVNTALVSLGLIDKPIDVLLYNLPSVLFALAYVNMGMVIAPCHIALRRIDRSLIEASQDLGANPFETFFRVTLPLSKPGIAVGFVLSFIPAAGAYFEPLLVGGTRGVMIGNVLANHFTGAIMWSRGAALAFLLILFMALLVIGWLKLMGSVELIEQG